jgi:hypothetical protein
MITVLTILAIALLVAIAGRAVEIGIASWSIRRTDRYRHRSAAAECATERESERRRNLINKTEAVSEYATKASWLLNFLHKRYGKFADLEKEIDEGPKDVTGDTPVGEADARYNDLKNALKIIRVTVKLSERMENLAGYIISQVDQIGADLRDEDEESESGESEPDKKEESREPEPEE